MELPSRAASPAWAITGPTAAASRAAYPLLHGPPIVGAVLGASSQVAWLRLGLQLLVLSGPGSARLPNGVALSDTADGFPYAGDAWVAGNGKLTVAAREIRVRRWWDPRPRLEPVSTEVLAAAVAEARPLLDPGINLPLATALVSFDPRAVAGAIRLVMGRGRGLTPEGDDIVVGVFAGLRLLGEALQAPGADRLLEAITPGVLAEAQIRTTVLSASLLGHAAAGEVAAPVAAFLRALTGRGDVTTAVAGLQAMGSTSGVATASGVLMAADALVKGGGG